ncbi:hypothetical protein [Rhodococcus sp. KRD197]|nr:hypothetical protein [Rhodococcus sp. KRD197]
MRRNFAVSEGTLTLLTANVARSAWCNTGGSGYLGAINLRVTA